MPMISRMEVEFAPPAMPGMTKCCATSPIRGWAMKNNGTTSRLAKTNTNIDRSQKRKLPLAVIATRATAAIGTAMNFETPKYPSARLTPMNSVTIVRKFKRNRSPTENQPQNRPKRSLISLA